MAVQLFQHKEGRKKEMNQTSNYGFNVPVGADIVNPLVQDFPNWESLDSILRNVANTGVVTATHTKTGTIHTLTFIDTTVPMIRFQATADFNTNDTFTVNGLSVSALTVSGEALPDGAFVIGSMVLCELRDNLLTVYASGSDASTLEGHPASYFATASDLQTVDGKADANKALIDQLDGDLSAYLDHATQVDSANTPMTAALDGWFCVYGRSPSGNVVEVRDGADLMWFGYLYSDGNNGTCSPLLPAKAGHTYTLNVVSGGSYDTHFIVYR